MGQVIKRNRPDAIETTRAILYFQKIKNSLLGRVCKEADEKSTGDCGDIAVDLQARFP